MQIIDTKFWIKICKLLNECYLTFQIKINVGDVHIFDRTDHSSNREDTAYAQM